MAPPAAHPDVRRTQDRPTQPPELHEHSAEEPDLWAYFDVLWARKFLLVGLTLAVAIVAAAITMVQPRRYSAEATIFLTPPTYATTLRPEAMSVEAYAKLAESEYMLSLVDAELRKTRPDRFPASQSSERLATYSARLTVSREPQKPYLPLVGLSAETDQPEKAKLAADTWADIFVREQSKFSELGQSNAADFILSEYPKVEQALWATEKALLEQQQEQARRLSALRTDVGMSLKWAQRESAENLVVRFENRLSSALTERDRLKPVVAELERELEATPQTLVVSKAITDEALWNAQATGSVRVEALTNARLQSQEVNPVYVALSQQLAEQRVELKALDPQVASLKSRIASARKEATAASAALLDGERRIEDLERAHTLDNSHLVRAVETSKKSFDKLAEKIGEAEIAKSEPGADLKLGAYADLPRSPSGPRRALTIVGAAALAFMLTAIALIVSSAFKGRVSHHQRAR